jgi:hypothetical protein
VDRRQQARIHVRACRLIGTISGPRTLSETCRNTNNYLITDENETKRPVGKFFGILGKGRRPIGYLLVGVDLIATLIAAWDASGSHIREGERQSGGQYVFKCARSFGLILLAFFPLSQDAILPSSRAFKSSAASS